MAYLYRERERERVPVQDDIFRFKTENPEENVFTLTPVSEFWIKGCGFKRRPVKENPTLTASDDVNSSLSLYISLIPRAILARHVRFSQIETVCVSRFWSRTDTSIDRKN